MGQAGHIACLLAPGQYVNWLEQALACRLQEVSPMAKPKMMGLPSGRRRAAPRDGAVLCVRELARWWVGSGL